MAESDEDLSSDKHSQSALPRIGIIDLMVLITAMALVFALREEMNRIGWSFRTDVMWFQCVEHVCYCVLYGLPVAAMYRFVIQKKHVGRFFLEPGHWLLMSTFLTVVSAAIPTLVISGQDESLILEGNAAWFFMPYVIFCIVASWILFRGTFVVGRWWKTCLALVAMMKLIEAAQQFLHYLSLSTITAWTGGGGNLALLFDSIEWSATALRGAICICLTLLVIGELWKGPARDLWHWAGILVSYTAYVCYPILSWIFITYLFDPKNFPLL